MASAAPSDTLSLASQLGNVPLDPDEDNEQAEITDEYSNPRRSTERKGSLVRQLEDQIDDINLARTLDEETLRKIGIAVVDEYKMDENSRTDWLDDAEAAMRFALQKSEQKQFPWPGCSNVIFPLIAPAAIEFASRTYPAVVQGRNVVKGIFWGSDNGTPVMENGQPKMEPVPQPGMGAPPNALPGAPNPGAPPAAAAMSAAPPGPASSPPAGPGAQPPAMQPVWMIAPGEKRKRADRVAEHMSWQLLKEMPSWEEELDALLHQIPIIGGAARKTYRDVTNVRNESVFVSLINLVWNYNAPSFEKAARHTEVLLLYPHEIEDFERVDEDDYGDGMFLHLDYGPGDGAVSDGVKFGFRRDGDGSSNAADPDAPHLFLEQHRRCDLDGDGYAEPYVVTVHARSAKVVRIVARYDKEGIKASKDGQTILKIDPVQYYTLIPFFPSLDGGSYPMGFGQLLRGLSDQIDSTLNQMFDAGTLQNAGGGFIGDNLNVASGQALFEVGKFFRVNTKGMAIRDSVYAIDFKGPSPVLFQLLGLLVESGKQFAGLQNILTGDASIANAPPTTVLALIEQGITTYTAIIKRVFRALGKEYDKLFRLNRIYMVDAETYMIGDDEQEIEPADYKRASGVQPIADPKMVTDMQKLARAQLLLEFKDDPLINQKEIRTRLFEAGNFERIDDLFAPPDPNAAAALQLEMAMKQGELGRLRAAEQKDTTQAFLNLALARKNATAQEEGFLQQQLEYFRLKIESLNTEVKAADVAGKHHAMALDHMDRVADRAHELALAGAGAPTPGPTGPFPVPPSAPVAPDVAGPNSPGTGTPIVPGPGPAPGV